MHVELEDDGGSLVSSSSILRTTTMQARYVDMLADRVCTEPNTEGQRHGDVVLNRILDGRLSLVHNTDEGTDYTAQRRGCL